MPNLRKGLNCFKSIPSKTEYKNIESGTLPSNFKIFIKNFSLGGKCIDSQYANLNENDRIRLTCVEFSKLINDVSYSNSVDRFFTIDEIELEIEMFQNQSHEYYDEGFIKIGYFDICDTILLKIDSGEIYALKGDWGYETPFVERLATDIFEFLGECQEVVINLNLMEFDLQLKDLIKNWEQGDWILEKNN